MGLRFYILDLESNGLRVGFHSICEISIIRATDRVQLSRQVKITNPENSSFDALKIIGKTINDLRYGISSQQMIEETEEFFAQDGLTPAHRCIVGHNIINFDRKFLWHIWEQFGKQFPADLYLDTLQLCKQVARKRGLVKPRLNLPAACDLFGIKKTANFHSAKSDTRYTYHLWKKLIDEQADYLPLIKRLGHRLDTELESEEDFFE